MVDNVFVLGLDEHNRRLLEWMPDAPGYRFHQLLSIEEMQRQDRIPLPELLAKAQGQLRAFPDTVDAIVGYWDFPVSSMVPILCRRFGLSNGPSLESVVKCEHKYWSRLEQRKVIDQYPRFGLVDLDSDEGPPAGLRYPLWLKPVKSFSSALAYRVCGLEQFHAARRKIRAGIARVGHPFDSVLAELRLPAEIAGIGGRACLAEEAMQGRQITVEGYRYRGETHVYGMVDSILCAGGPSFLRFQYPSSVPPAVASEMTDISRRVVRQIGLNNSTFNIEFFWDPDTGNVGLLEINPRHSQSHAPLFQQVDGVANHQCMLRLAFGRHPRPPHRQGRYAIAAEWFLRHFSDGVVARCPSPHQVAKVERELPGTTVGLIVRPGDRLSRLHDQDSYSYKLAKVYVSGADEAELVAKFHRCEQALRFEIDDVAPDGSPLTRCKTLAT
jgi:hypothetical protein